MKLTTIVKQLNKRFEFSSEHELKETASAILSYDKDILKGIKPNDAYKRIETSFGVIYAENVKDFNRARLVKA